MRVDSRVGKWLVQEIFPLLGVSRIADKSICFRQDNKLTEFIKCIVCVHSSLGSLLWTAHMCS